MSVEHPFSSMPRSHHVNEVLTTTCLRCNYVHAVLTTSLLRSYCVLARPFFEHVQNSTTSFKSMKTLLGSYYIYVQQVSTTLLLRPTSSYCVHLFFQGRRKNVAQCEGGTCIPFVIKICVLSSYDRAYCTTFPTSFKKVVI